MSIVTTEAPVFFIAFVIKDMFEIFLSLKANYQNLTEWLERLESQKNLLYVTRMNVKKIWQPQMFSLKFKLI